MALDAEGVSRIPSNPTFEEAATLPCAASRRGAVVFSFAMAAGRIGVF